MKRIIRLMAFLILGGSVMAANGPSAEGPQKAKQGPNTSVLIVSGVNKDPEERQAKDGAVIKLRKFFLSNAGISPENLRVLVDSNSFAREGAGISTADNLRKTLEGLTASVKTGDRFILYYVGQANIVAGVLRMNLPGEDITGEQLAEWVNKIEPAQMLVVLDCPGAGLAVKALKGAGRIIVCSSRSDQPYSTRFSEYFIPAMVDSASDTDTDGRISLLEAFTSASKQLDELYRERDLLKTETPILEDDGDGIPSQQPWRYEKDKHDGLAASQFFFTN